MLEGDFHLAQADLRNSHEVPRPGERHVRPGLLGDLRRPTCVLKALRSGAIERGHTRQPDVSDRQRFAGTRRFQYVACLLELSPRKVTPEKLPAAAAQGQAMACGL